MSLPDTYQPDSSRDLLLERVVDVPPALVWDAWTRPEHIVRWFTPSPWTTPHCEIDLRPGGKFLTVMRSPEGEEMTNLGCYLEVIEHDRLVWTSVMDPGYRPSPGAGELHFTAVISFEPSGSGTKYSALAMHPDPTTCSAHADMGFHEGWGAALDQLVALMKTV